MEELVLALDQAGAYNIEQNIPFADTMAGNLKKVSLELGGKSPNVVFKDADLEQAISGAASAIFFNHGQCCCAGSRLYVEQSVFDRVSEGVAEHAQKIKVGSGLDSSTEMGPLVSDVQLSRVCGYLESGVAEGARTLVGGKKIGDAGYFVEPTVLVDAKPQTKYESNGHAFSVRRGLRRVATLHPDVRSLQAGRNRPQDEVISLGEARFGRSAEVG